MIAFVIDGCSRDSLSSSPDVVVLLLIILLDIALAMRSASFRRWLRGQGSPHGDR